MKRLMKRKSRRKLILSAASLLLLVSAIVGGRQWYCSRPGYGLPYYAQFTPDVEDRWTALGGAWEVVDGSMRNDSNDRGAKLLTGSHNWKDYTVEGDVQLLGSGSVGFLARVSEAELGENSYKGYFAGVRTADNSLVIGSYDFAYHEVTKAPLPDPVRPFRWYHVKMTAHGCTITATVRAVGLPELKTTPVNDPDCYRSGEIGLRSNGTGGAWRNVRVTPAGSPTTAPDRAAPSLPLTEPPPSQLRAGMPGSKEQLVGEESPSAPVQTIRSLLYLAPFGSPAVSVRGTVVLLRPAIYLQDSSGAGVEVQTDGATQVKIGDEVEVTGQVNLDRLNPMLSKARFRLLGEAVPIPPMVLTASQIAEGHYDGMFVQVEGLLQTISAKGDTLAMDLDAGTQWFHAILPAGRSRSHVGGLTLRSRLRLRGVSVVDPRFNTEADPFVILVRSAEDVDVVAGPPWWRPSNLILAGLVALALIFTSNHLYLLAKHWRLRAITEERERLAHEIHDTLAQSFAGIGFQLQAIRNSIPRNAQILERQVERAMLMARASHEEARRSIANLHPEPLGRMGLLPALRECAERMVKSGKVTVETYGGDDGRLVPVHVKDTLFLIGQEAIANSIRHAGPETIRIRLHQQRTSLSLLVEDDGHGFIADGDHAGFGLLGMHKRAESISATLVIRSAPGSGTQVEVKAAIGSSFLGVVRHYRSVKHRSLHN
jgi:signal transduction histidine kinase